MFVCHTRKRSHLRVDVQVFPGKGLLSMARWDELPKSAVGRPIARFDGTSASEKLYKDLFTSICRTTLYGRLDVMITVLTVGKSRDSSIVNT